MGGGAEQIPHFGEVGGEGEGSVICIYMFHKVYSGI